MSKRSLLKQSQNDNESCNHPNAKIRKIDKDFDSRTLPGSGIKLNQHGNIFQLRLLMLILWRARNNNFTDFSLATEFPDAGKFDDVVLQYFNGRNWKAVCLQAKHKETDPKKDIEKVTKASIMSASDDFSIAKYFHSFVSIQRIQEATRKGLQNSDLIGDVENVILITNTEFENQELTDCFEIDQDPHLENNRLLTTCGLMPRKYCIGPALQRELRPIFKLNSEFNELVEKVIQCIFDKKQKFDKTIAIFRKYYDFLIQHVFVQKAKKKDTVLNFSKEFLNNQTLGSVDLDDFRNALMSEYQFRKNQSALNISEKFGSDKLPTAANEVDAIADKMTAMILNNLEFQAADYGEYYHAIKTSVFNCQQRRFLSKFVKDASPLKNTLKAKLGNKTNEELSKIQLKGDEFFDTEFPKCEEKLANLAKLFEDHIERGVLLEPTSCPEFQLYHGFLAKEVINISKKKFHDFFVSGDVKKLSTVAQVFRKKLVNCRNLQIKEVARFLETEEISVSAGSSTTDDVDNSKSEKTLSGSKVTDDDVDKFFEKFCIITNYPDRSKIREILSNEIKNAYNFLDSEGFISIFETDLHEWMACRIGSYYTPSKADQLLKKITEHLSCFEVDGLSESYFRKIPKNFQFKTVNQIEQFLRGPADILNLNFENSELGRIRTVQSFKRLQSMDEEAFSKYTRKFGYIFMQLHQFSNSDFKSMIFDRCKDNGKWNLLVIECDLSETQKSNEVRIDQIISKLRDEERKKIILITATESSKNLENFPNESIFTRVGDLTDESQAYLHKNGVVLLQNRKLLIEEALSNEDIEIIDSFTLCQLINEEAVKIGSENALENVGYVENIYISRFLLNPIFPLNRMSMATNYGDSVFSLQYKNEKNEDRIDLYVLGNDRNAFANCLKNKSENVARVHWIDDNFTCVEYFDSLSNLHRKNSIENNDADDDEKDDDVEDDDEEDDDEEDDDEEDDDEKDDDENGLTCFQSVDSRLSDFLKYIENCIKNIDADDDEKDEDEEDDHEENDDEEDDDEKNENYYFTFKDETRELTRIIRMFRGMIHQVTMMTKNVEADKFAAKFELIKSVAEFCKYTNASVSESEFTDSMKDRKVAIISDDPGTGKSTLLSNLSKLLAVKYPRLWQIRINLNDYSEFLDEHQRQKQIAKLAEFLLKLLQSKPHSQVTSNFEIALFRNIFHQNEPKLKFAIMFDGFDEISPHYMDVVLRLLSKLQESNSVGKLFITTRPNFGNDLEETLRTTAFRILPLTWQDMVALLRNSWKKCGKFDDSQLENIAGWLISVLSEKIVDTNLHFSGVPLHLRMIAEIEFDNALDVFTDQFTIYTLYDEYVKKKIEIYYREKMIVDIKTTASKQQIESYVPQFMKHHQRLSLATLLTETDLKDLISDEDYFEKLVDDIKSAIDRIEKGNEKAGIVVNIINGRPNFVHRTFAEFFLAVLLGEILYEGNQRKLKRWSFRFLAKEVLMEIRYATVRKFLDGYISQRTSVKYEEKPLERFGREISYQLYSTTIVNENLLLISYREGLTNLLSIIFHAFRPHQQEFFSFYSAFNVKQLRPRFRGRRLLSSEDIYWSDDCGKFLLHLAIREGDIDYFKKLVENGADPTSYDMKEWNSLRYAIIRGSKEICKWLTDRKENGGCGLDVKMETVEKLTLLHLAMFRTKFVSGSLEICDGLVRSGVEIDARTNDGYTALHFACLNGSYDMCEWLVNAVDQDKKTDFVNIVNDNGYSAIHHLAAFQPDYLRFLKFLVENGGDATLLNKSGWSALHNAAREGNFDACRWLIEENGCSPGQRAKDGSSMLHIADCRRNPVQFLEVLTTKDVDIDCVDDYGQTAMHHAVRFGDSTKYKYIFSLYQNEGNRVSVSDDEGSTILHEAVSSSDSETVKWALETHCEGFQQDKMGRTPLHYAAGRGNPDICQQLLDALGESAGTNLAIRDIHGWTALHFAASYGRFNAAKLLIERGADVELFDNRNRSMSHHAAISGNPELFEWIAELQSANIHATNDVTVFQESVLSGSLLTSKLASVEADFNATDPKGNTTLHYAAASGQLSICEWLIDTFSNSEELLNAKNTFGCTPLHLSTNGQLKLVQYLVLKGANIGCIDKNGLTVMHYAALNGNIGVCKWLVGREKYEQSAISTKSLIQKHPMPLITTTTKTGATVLHAAAKSGDFELCRWLVKNGANINTVDLEGHSALFYAVSSSQFGNDIFASTVQNAIGSLGGTNEFDKWRIVAWLVSNGLAIDARSKSGETVLHWAAATGNFEVIEWSLTKTTLKALINVKNQDGRTALHQCAASDVFMQDTLNPYIFRESYIGCSRFRYVFKDRLYAAKVLTEHGGNIDEVDNNGETVLNLAARSGNTSLHRWLVSHKSHGEANVQAMRPADENENKQS